MVSSQDILIRERHRSQAHQVRPISIAQWRCDAYTVITLCKRTGPRVACTKVRTEYSTLKQHLQPRFPIT